MAGIWGAHYWLFTGREWEQDRENFKCDAGFCDHDHVTRDERPKQERPKPTARDKWIAVGGLLFTLALFAAMVWVSTHID